MPARCSAARAANAPTANAPTANAPTARCLSNAGRLAACGISVTEMLRTASWLVYGARWFTASGYERSAQGFDPRDDQVRAIAQRRRCSHARPDISQADCSHRSYVVTGANSGIGRAVALSLAKRGATVHMYARHAPSLTVFL